MSGPRSPAQDGHDSLLKQGHLHPCGLAWISRKKDKNYTQQTNVNHSLSYGILGTEEDVQGPGV